ncbi:hypothetical protein M2275_003147 [Rhodococcus opacus]|nr:LacI family DNA-binding transcriptional regulator [Rhodococcus opacus]MDH6288241.1 hypothetical protein [Rhodococcus opacus]
MTDNGDLTDVRASRPTIVDVAARAGVSKSLVSVVLRGRTGVSAANRAAVLRAVDELGYRPNAAARSQAQKRTYIVGALLGDLRNPWFIDLLASARAELSAHGRICFWPRITNSRRTPPGSTPSSRPESTGCSPSVRFRPPNNCSRPHGRCRRSLPRGANPTCRVSTS